MALMDRVRHAWNAFRNRDPTRVPTHVGPSYGSRPDYFRFSRGTDRTIATALYNRIAMDCAAVRLRHIVQDENGRFVKEVPSGLNSCLSLEANIDQTGRAFIQDLVMSMLDEGHVVAVPVDLDDEPSEDGNLKIITMRTGVVTEWYPYHVKVKVYNERRGEKQEIILPKTMVSIIENPLRSVINEPNSTMQRLIRKLAMLDAVDEQTSSGRMDLIIQLPYVIKSPQRQAQAEQRRKDIERQLAEGKYGIAYTDGTERVIQLNRPVENNLMKQIEYLTNMLYSQLGMSQSILDGTADDMTRLNYYNQTIEPILSAIADEMKRKFLGTGARTKGHTIEYFRDPFRLVPTEKLAELADKFTRNAIMTSNEWRQIIGLKPSDDAEADELRNKNLPKAKDQGVMPVNGEQMPAGASPGSEEPIAQSDDDVVEELLQTLERQIDEIIAGAGGSG